MLSEIMNIKLIIDGESRISSGGSIYSDINPANQEVIATVQIADDKDVDDAVLSSKIAFEEWSKINPSERGARLFKLAELVNEHIKDLAFLDCIDAGKPLVDCEEDVNASVDLIRFFAGMADKLRGNTIPVQRDHMVMTLREPYGVIGAIVPWNYPIFNACAKIAPIIAMGNTCILKPAEQTPLSAVRLGELTLEANIPKGVLNVLTGNGKVGNAIARHMDIDKVSFTGSTEVGRLILKASADSNLKPCTLELGGKSPCIVFGDSDIAKAAKATAYSAFFNQGQTCTAATRLLVHNSVADAMIEKLVDLAESVKVGNPLDPDNRLGPVISLDQYSRIYNYIEAGVNAGAKLRAGGLPSKQISPGNGFYLRPTIFENVSSDSVIAREEIFGPVLSVFRFDTEEEAIQLANATQYGLAASVWTQNIGRIMRMISNIKSGVVWCNCSFKEHPAAPVGGHKLSGFGSEYGIEAAYEYSRIKTVWLDTSGTEYDWIS